MNAEEVYALLNKKIKKGGITDDQIKQIVEQYLEKNPVQVITDNTLSVAGMPADALSTGTAIDWLTEDLEDENGKRAKPIKALKNITITNFYDTGVSSIKGHRYVLVCTPIIRAKNFTFGNLVSGTLPEKVDGVTYFATLTASQDGSLRLFPQGEPIEMKELYIFDTTNDDKLHDFVSNALYLATELLYDIKNGYRNVIQIPQTDNEFDLFFKFLISAKVGKCDLIFDGGTFNLSDVYVYMKTIFNYTFRNELPIGNDCRYFFNGATLNATLPNSSYADFTNLMGCKWNKGSYELYDGTLISNGMIYTIHDEMTGQDEYTHKYSNMILKSNTTPNQTSNLRKCIGGGAGRYANIVLDKCVLVSDYSHELSFHGYGNILGNVDGKITLNISDCYFGHGIQLDTLPDKEIGTIITVCNSFRRDYADYINNNWIKYSWNNESRVN